MRNNGKLVLNPGKFRVALAVAGVEQRDVAAFIGHDPSWITHVKKHVFYPSPKDVRGIARFFGVRIEDLFEQNGQ